jgi:hypothetical protein
MAESLGPDNAELRDTMREVAEQWHRLAADAEARRCNPLHGVLRHDPTVLLRLLGKQ